MHDRNSQDIMRELAALPASDRRAILKLLTQDERSRVSALASRHAGADRSSTSQPATRAALNAYSPWLAKRLSVAAGDPRAPGAPGVAVTEATRRLLDDLMSKSAEA